MLVWGVPEIVGTRLLERKRLTALVASDANAPGPRGKDEALTQFEVHPVGCRIRGDGEPRKWHNFCTG